MRRQVLFYLAGLSFVLALSGCVVRTYTVTKDRSDQDLTTGNRGYVKGEGAGLEAKERKTTRTTQVVEIELHSPIKFEKMPKAKVEEKAAVEKAEEQPSEGNRGYIMQTITPEIAEAPAEQSYTVRKGDTLQKISEKFYGTSKRWTKIYNANKDVLKGPDKVYPGQVLRIPDAPSPLKEPKENLK